MKQEQSFPYMGISRADTTIVIPVYNEQKLLRAGVTKLIAALHQHCLTDVEIVIVDNGSEDGTLQVGRALEKEERLVRCLQMDRRGRGGALKAAWLAGNSRVLSYMDADMSTDLTALPHLISPLLSGDYDIAVGSRLLEGSRTDRCLRREAISRAYNLLLRGCFGARFSDAQCGFKSITKEAAQRLLPLVEDNDWFMDTEMLLIAQRLGYRILQVPVHWVERRDSRVKITTTAVQDLWGLWRLHKRLSHLASTYALAADGSRT